MPKDEMLENAKQLMNYIYYWKMGYTDYSNGSPEGYGVCGETTTEEEKDAYMTGWNEAKEKRSDKCQKLKF